MSSRYLHSYTLAACRQRDRLTSDLKAILDQTVRTLTRHPETGWHEPPDGNRDMTGLRSTWAGPTLIVTYRLVSDPAQVVIVAVEPRRPASADPARAGELLEA